jgi:hypothetical protein
LCLRAVESPANDHHSRNACAKLYSNKMPVTAVHLLNSDVLTTIEQHKPRTTTTSSDNDREFCGRSDRHTYDLLL